MARHRFGVFELDEETGELRKQGRVVRLQPQPVKLLGLLLERPGHLVTRDEVRQRLWGADTFVDFDQSLNFCIKQIRAALGDDADSPRFVETVPRRGYRFIAPLHGAESQPPAAAATQSDRRTFAWWRATASAAGLAALVLLVSTVWLALQLRRSARDTTRAVQFDVTPETGGPFPADMTPAISPDGKTVVFAAGLEGQGALYARALGDATLARLRGTEHAEWPFFSPDGRRLGFFVDRTLKVLDLESGVVTSVCVLGDDPRGGSWNRSDVVLVGQRGGAIVRVSLDRGTIANVTAAGDGHDDFGQLWPYFLPDQRHFLLTQRGTARENRGLYVAELGSTAIRRVLPDFTNAVVADGRLVYAREPFRDHVPLFSAWRSVIVDRAALVAQPFDLGRLAVRGDPIALASDVRYWAARGLATFDAVDRGLLTYRRADGRPQTRLEWIDRSGRRVGDFGEDTYYPHPEISPDGSKVAYQRLDVAAGSSNIWIADLVRNLRTRLTFDTAVDSLPVWSPDGARVAFASDRDATPDLFVKEVSGTSPERRIGRSPFVMFPTAWSPDGTTILYQHHRSSDANLDAIDADGDGAGWVFARGGANDASAQFSPDGRWVAYVTGHGDRVPLATNGDRPQVIVQDYPRHDGTWQISGGNGWEPRWRRDGRELFFLTIDGDGRADVMASDVDIRRGRFAFDRPHRLFTVPVWMGPPTPRNHYDVTSDGQRFLIDVLVQRQPSQPLTIRLLP